MPNLRMPRENTDKVKLEEQRCCRYYSGRLRFEKANYKLNITYFYTVPTNQNFSVYSQLAFYIQKGLTLLYFSFAIHFQH